jgi:hypothetical protein
MAVLETVRKVHLDAVAAYKERIISAVAAGKYAEASRYYSMIEGMQTQYTELCERLKDDDGD